ncbi:beta-1,6-N-acetylglucosaminyltransferase [Vibrio fluvialis]|uniref:beta-1,6-N-acetylglucosaminyltransferase n=1 Tax=Vibrio fluvialis TaxID=676 RepID=UPI001120C195|nr:hypothetical protein DJ016_21280 [Vibrio fluvialis]TRN08626.1 hypothetical protein DM587_20750 [Vibrio fluvialis]
MGHYSQVVVTINLLEHALKDHNSAFTLLSGECLPIKNVSDFIRFVSSSNKSFLAHSIQPEMRTRVSKIHFLVDKNISKISPAEERFYFSALYYRCVVLEIVISIT